MIQVPTTLLAKVSIDPKFVELTADVLRILFIIGMLLFDSEGQPKPDKMIGKKNEKKTKTIK